MLAFNLCVEFTSQAVWTKPKEKIAIVIPENLRHGKPDCYEPDQTNWSCSLFWGLARQFGHPADTLFDFCKNLLTVGLLFGSVDSDMHVLCSKNQHVCSFSQSIAFDSQTENQDHWRSIAMAIKINWKYSLCILYLLTWLVLRWVVFDSQIEGQHHSRGMRIRCNTYLAQVTFCVCIRNCIVFVVHKVTVRKLLTLIVVPVKVGHLPSSAGGRICDIDIVHIWGWSHIYTVAGG